MEGNDFSFDRDGSGSTSSMSGISSTADIGQLDLTPIKTNLQIYWDMPKPPSRHISPSSARSDQCSKSIIFLPRRLRSALSKPKFNNEEQERLIPWKMLSKERVSNGVYLDSRRLGSFYLNRKTWFDCWIALHLRNHGLGLNNAKATLIQQPLEKHTKIAAKSFAIVSQSLGIFGTAFIHIAVHAQIQY